MSKNDHASAFTIVKIDGFDAVVGTPEVTVLEQDADNFVIKAKGATVPTAGDAGYAKGCSFIDTSGSLGNTLYINEGSETSANFQQAGNVKTAKVTLTAQEVKALRATPATLVPAGGADTLIVVDSVVLKLNYGGSNGFTESADNFVVQYDDSGVDITGAIENTGFIDQTADTAAIYYPANIAAMATATVGVNEGVQLFNTGDGEIGGNAADDNTLDVWVSYKVINVA